MASASPADPLSRLRLAPGATAILSDFDGTLAPIVDDPAAATALPGAVDALHALAERYAVVAVISGRPASFLVDRLALRPGHRLRASGLYGLEDVHDAAVADRGDVGRWRPVVEEVAAAAEHDGPTGLVVERKGLSLTLHWRASPAVATAALAWAEGAAARSGLELRPARASAELHPPVGTDKGTVVTELVGDLATACYLGDDVGDLAAFAALRRLREEGRETVAVAVASDEAPAALLAAADVVVDGPTGALAVLRSLLA